MQPDVSHCPAQIYISGSIDQEAADAFLKLSSVCDGVKSVIVNSTGGDSASSIAISNEIRRKNYQVEVRGLCASACANFILLPSPRSVVTDNSVVLFHHTQSSLYYLFKKYLPNSKVDFERMRKSAEAEQVAYRAWGISDQWLYGPLVKMEVGCVEEMRNDAGFGEYLPRYRAKYVGWAPSSESIPGNIRWNGLKNSKPLKVDLKILFGGGIENADVRLSKLLVCPPRNDVDN